jgi:hypothetical protein
MSSIRMGVVLLAASAAFLAAQDPPSRVGRLNYREGPVSFQPTGMNEWVDADINRPLTTGDNIWVGERGRAEFHVGSTTLRLSENSDFQFLNLDDQTVQIRLSGGTLTVRLRVLAANQIVEVDTPDLAFNLVRPGEYRIDANPASQTTTITVRDGEGEVTGGGQTFPIYARQRVVVSGNDQFNYNLTSAGGGDEFDQWSTTRDRREDQSQSARYVSREVPGYEDLDQYGRWGNQPGYGQVWMPTTVAAGWAPYHDGHWAWIDPWGWTWVDDAPWGFAPYHYGRWASFGGRWGWVPGPYGVTPVYAPALVGWVGGGRGGAGFSMSFSTGNAAAVGWFPLGPREPYFPPYQGSESYFRRVNNTNTVINNTAINNYYGMRNSNNTSVTYVNRRVPDGVTAVPQNTFASGRRVNQYARAVPAAQMNSVQVVAAPPIAPQRASILGPRADTTSRAARPPANMLSRPVVARTAPPQTAIPFDQQQAALARTPGRPLPPAEVRQMRQSAPPPIAPVRVVDMGQVRRVQPRVGVEPQPGQQPNIPQSPVSDRNTVPPGQQRQQQQDAQKQQQLKQQQDVQQQQQQRQQQDAQKQQQLKQQQDGQQQQQQRQQQDAQKQQQLKQQQDGQQQQQQRQQQDAQNQQQLKQQQDTQRQQQLKQQQEGQQQQQRQQQDAQKQQQLKQQQDAQKLQQLKQQQDVQLQQQQRQQQDAQKQQQLKQQQDVQQQQQQRQQQDAQKQQQLKQQQDGQQQQQQRQQQDAQRQQQLRQQQDPQPKKENVTPPQSAKTQPPAVETPQSQDPGKKQKPPAKDEKKPNQ